MTADPRLLATFDGKQGRWQLAAGTYRIALATSAVDVVSTATLH
jgi:beta-glucosidase